MIKNLAEFENRQRATLLKKYLRTCPVCGIQELMAKNQKYCTPQCKGMVQYIDGSSSTEEQYKKINGNWKKYMQRLLYVGGRKRDKLTWEILIELLDKQNFKCALTGEQLTCNLEIGKNFLTNASIDRKIAGGSYTKDNIQLVCKAVNFWRGEIPINEYINWCKKVVEYNK